MKNKEKEIRCILCGKVIVIEKSSNSWDEEDDFITIPKKSVSFCTMCEAKLRKESDDQIKGTKPM